MNPKIQYDLNLKVIKRYDPNIIAILDSSSHSVIYDFDEKQIGWKLANYSGPLFLFKRKIAPFYGIFILNRENLNNFIFYLSNECQVSYNEYINVKRPENGIFGIWLYEESDRARIASALDIYSRVMADDITSPKFEENFNLSTINKNY
ncbi:PH domain-like protein [Neoconidiobolus thromboides FSU 785]|nr:PH domain-like protein [Neoconidiobolus thromboides FSU 785]